MSKIVVAVRESSGTRTLVPWLGLSCCPSRRARGSSLVVGIPRRDGMQSPSFRGIVGRCNQNLPSFVPGLLLLAKWSRLQ